MRFIVRPPGSAVGPSPRKVARRRRGGPRPEANPWRGFSSFDGVNRGEHANCGKLAKGEWTEAARLASAD